jgi:16S rRNA (guanine(1405)-N(7))-methyltransferase
MASCYASIIPTGPRIVLDLACGLSPFALPWMGLGEDTTYIPLDIDLELAKQTNRFLSKFGREATAGCHDLMSGLPAVHADVVLLLKTLPTLERQSTGSARDLLARFRTATVIVSFAVRSLGGRDKGMEDQYSSWFCEISPERRKQKFPYPGEIFYRLWPE